MSEMVERVAKAISGAPFASEASRRKARAAIEAMLSYMKEDGEAHGHCSPDTPIQIQVKRLTAALSPSREDEK